MVRYRIFLLSVFFSFLQFFSCEVVPQIINPVAPIVYIASSGSANFICDGESDQQEINAALDFVAENSEYTTVFLKGPTTFWIDEPIYISSNTILEGDEDAVVKLIDEAKWNKQFKPLIGQKGTVFELGIDDVDIRTENITIRNFELNGNRANQIEASGNSYYRMIQLQNSYNITINDMFIHNGLADGIIILPYNPDVQVSINSEFFNNRIHFDGHDGIYIENATDFEIHDNIITNTRTDASVRCQNCNKFKIYNNIAGNAPDRNTSGVSALHIMSYGDKPVNDVEIYNNFFYGNQRCYGIWLEQLKKGGAGDLDTHTGVYIHNNIISQYELAGIGIKGFNKTRIENNTIEVSIGKLSFDNPLGGSVYEHLEGGSGIQFYNGDPLDESLSGFETFVKNNIIIYNTTYGIENKVPSVHTFISENNCIYENKIGNYKDVSSTTDIYDDPLILSEYIDYNDDYPLPDGFGRWYNATTYYIFSPLWEDVDGSSEIPQAKTDLGASQALNYYHLKSKEGRWDSSSSSWVKDLVDSPCIDAGVTTSTYSNEPSPNGNRVNIGAFGNSDTASKSGP